MGYIMPMEKYCSSLEMFISES